MKNLINYSSGGLSNVLMPLSSSIYLSKIMNRNLIVCMEPTFRCQINLNDIFENNINIINFNDLNNYSQLQIFANKDDIQLTTVLYGNDTLKKLNELYGSKPVSLFDINDDSDNILIYHNDFLTQVNIEDSLNELRNLKIKPHILLEFNNFIINNNITKKTYGVHARGTDYVHDSIEPYSQKILDLINLENDCKIFFCSDDPEWESYIYNKFPNNVIIRKKNSKLIKNNPSVNSWVNNVLTDKNAVIDGFIDLLILSKCHLHMYNIHSSFAKLANIL